MPEHVVFAFEQGFYFAVDFGKSGVFFKIGVFVRQNDTLFAVPVRQMKLTFGVYKNIPLFEYVKTFVAKYVPESTNFCGRFINACTFDIKKDEIHNFLIPKPRPLDKRANLYYNRCVMKKILTVIALRGEVTAESAEIITACEGEDFPEFLRRAVKCAKGKYALICEFCDGNTLDGVLKVLESTSADIVEFKNATAVKSSALKGVKNFFGRIDLLVSAETDCKDIAFYDDAPALFGLPPVYDEDELLNAVDVFGKTKAKLTKDIYTNVSARLCRALALFYADSLIKGYKSVEERQRLLKFDKTVKTDIVLYHSLETKLAAVNLSKLKKKSFKISFITKLKLKKILSSKG